MKLSPSLVPTLSAVTLLLALTACRESTYVSTRSAGHDISAQIEGDHSVDSETNRAIFTSEFGRITVEVTRVQLGDGPWTTIPEGVPLDLGISKHKRWVTADRVSVKESSY
jgi:hypothetical protein